MAKKYKRKATQKQRKAFEHLKSGLTQQEAMLKAGYSKATSTHPKQNLIDRSGTQSLMDQYREELKKAGVSIDVLAEVQSAGLFEEDPKVRLEYLKENKKDLGLAENQSENPNLKRRIIAEEFFGEALD